MFAAPGGNGNGKGPQNGPPGNSWNTPASVRAKGKVFIKAPEIDAAAGVQAIVLMTGGLLLVAERRRRQRG